jgi:NAD(P)-dependent dehydrogenase (short-subunit alcohol dehydrogenase family)
MLTDLKGRTAVVTGAANGIGLGLAEALAQAGCKLVLVDIEADTLETVAGRLRRAGSEVMAVTADVASWDQVQELAAETKVRFGGVDLVCANAGVTLVGRPVAALSMNDWNWVIGTNLFGVIHTVQAFLPLLREADEAHIVITASGVCSFMGVALNAPYCASKAAILSYAETLYREMKTSGSPIGVTALCPGAVSATLNLSERRRPANLPDLCETDLAPPGFRENLEKMRNEGLKPASVAQSCLAAIREDRFYVITHPENGDMVEARGKDARAGRNPQGDVTLSLQRT